jgi:hypothetical protein
MLAGMLVPAFALMAARSVLCMENALVRQEENSGCKESVSENETKHSVSNSENLSEPTLEHTNPNQYPVSNQTDLQELPYKYFGNSNSQKFHRPSCPYGRVISATHLMPFHFRREAVAAGYTPCHYCLPQAWGSVRCFILPPQEEAKTPQSKNDNSTIRLDANGNSL